ncbi:MAG: GtrA family protein [Chitinophagaceae bacterium]
MKAIHAAIRKLILSVIDFFYPLFNKVMPLQTFRYAACGGGNTLLDIILFTVAYNFIFKGQPLHITDKINPTAHSISILFSFVFTFPIGFYLNRYVVFQEAKAAKREQLIKYFAVVMFCLVLNYGFMKFFVEVFVWNAIFSKFITTIFLVIFSYFSQKHFTFKLEDGTELID